MITLKTFSAYIMTLVMAVCCCAIALANETAEQRVNQFFEQVTTYEANFVQEVLDEGGNEIQRATGILKLKRPGRFLWEYLTPSPQLIMADGRNLWIYDVELEQATVKGIDVALGSAPIALLTESRPLSENFDIHQSAPRDGLDWIELIPHVQDTEFRRIEFGMDGINIARMQLYDQFGQKTIISFDKTRTNTDIADSAFEFNLPDGVDLIGEPL